VWSERRRRRRRRRRRSPKATTVTTNSWRSCEIFEGELEKICNDNLKILNEKLIPKASGGEAKVFYPNMKVDYSLYIVEY